MCSGSAAAHSVPVVITILPHTAEGRAAGPNGIAEVIGRGHITGAHQHLKVLAGGVHRVFNGRSSGLGGKYLLRLCGIIKVGTIGGRTVKLAVHDSQHRIRYGGGGHGAFVGRVDLFQLKLTAVIGSVGTAAPVVKLEAQRRTRLVELTRTVHDDKVVGHSTRLEAPPARRLHFCDGQLRVVGSSRIHIFVGNAVAYIVRTVAAGHKIPFTTFRRATYANQCAALFSNVLAVAIAFQGKVDRSVLSPSDGSICK